YEPAHARPLAEQLTGGAMGVVQSDDMLLRRFDVQRHEGLAVLAPSSIACIRVDRVGDLVCLLPALASLRAAFPSARIDVLCSPANAPLLENDPNVDHVRVFDYPPRRQVWRLAAAMVREFRRRRYDMVLAFYSRTHTHLATALSGAR